MTIRKNFHFDEEVAKHLAEIATLEGKTQTQIAQEAIEARYKQISTKKKLEALERLSGSMTELIGDVDIKKVREERAVKRAK
jgi:hypothetical protein